MVPHIKGKTHITSVREQDNDNIWTFIIQSSPAVPGVQNKDKGSMTYIYVLGETCKIFVRNPSGNKPLENPSIVGRTILNHTFKTV
jgi:hypothetical protein